MTVLGPGVKVRCISDPSHICAFGGDQPVVGCVYTVRSVLELSVINISLEELVCVACGHPIFNARHFRPIDDEGEAEIRRLSKLINTPVRIHEPA